MTLCLVIVSSLFNDDQNTAVLTELWMTQLLSLRARPASVVWGALSYTIPAHNKRCEAGPCKVCVLCNTEGVHHNHSRQEMLLEPGSAAQSSQQSCNKAAERWYNI